MIDALPAVPNLIERDPAVIQAQVIADLEAELGRTLQPAQVETLIAHVLAYRESLIRIAVQDVGTQNLVAFARAPMLDFLGELVGAVRIPAAGARATIRFTLTAIQPAAVVVPAGTRVQTTDGKITFATEEEMVIPSGLAFGTVLGIATVAGDSGNSYAPGFVAVILDPVAFVATAANDDETHSGAAAEEDDPYRDRIRQAPNQFSVAGSVAAYRFHALSVSSTIVDVAVTSPAPGVVRLYVLTDDGLPSPALLDEVEAAVSADTVRPLTDTVEVVAPAPVEYSIDATIRLLVGVDSAAALAAAEAAANAYAEERSAGLGRDIVPSQVIAALSVDGVYDVALAAPALIELDENEWPVCTDVTITLGAPAEG